ncbi:class I SAM-dependent methyltransferase [Paenibacillus sp. HJGM_3]|uniref:class I SAM-dependent methyltransferase n=1 Tax=Paenibacillus sp. HJGM_3 TaxID=3379816 RepID=UPI00385E4C0F
MSEQIGWGFTSMSLTRTSLVQLCRRVEAEAGPIRLLELGGGQSTLFWWALQQLELLEMEVTTLEHHEEWARNLQTKVASERRMRVVKQSLRQVSEEEWAQLFHDPLGAAASWSRLGVTVPKAQHEWFSIRNAFYGEADQLGYAPESIDVLIVDGPHGNGRALAFPLFCQALNPKALVLVDDFDCYPYLDDLGRVFHYVELYREVMGDKRSVLLQLQGMKL